MNSTLTQQDIDRTPNVPDDQERYSSITISVKIVCDGRELNRKQIAKLCQRLEKTARGRSSTREVSAIC